MKLMIFALFWPFLLMAQVEPAVRQEKRFFAAGEWAPFDLIVPSKWGLHAGINTDATQSWELEYLRGSWAVPFFVDDIGSVVDDRISLTGRSYGEGSFNFLYGLDYLRFRVHLGNEILNRISGGNTKSYEVLELYTFGAHIGFGNRWALEKNLVFGVDWFTWTQPLYVNYRNTPYLNANGDDRDQKEVRDVLKFVEYFPRFTLLRLTLGMYF